MPHAFLVNKSIVIPPVFVDAARALAKEDDCLRDALCSAYQDHQSFCKKFTEPGAVRILQMILECTTADHLDHVEQNLRSFTRFYANDAGNEFKAWASTFRNEKQRMLYQQKWAVERRVRGRRGFSASNSEGLTAKAQVKKWVAEVGLQDRAERGRMFDELVRAYDNLGSASVGEVRAAAEVPS
ncbi:hypothetical protein LTS18_006086, partial [Coniosporium uncinatum]